MPETLDYAKPYESQRALLARMSLRERRISMMRSRGLINPNEDDVLGKLNGNSYTPLKQFLEETYQREK